MTNAETDRYYELDMQRSVIEMEWRPIEESKEQFE
jgi:hypothetical protein